MRVDHLTKIRVTLAAGRSAEAMDLIHQPVSWSFVTGAGAEGLTPFEMACHQKSIGDEISIEIPPREPHRIFEHLRPPILADLVDDCPIFLKAVVADVAQASSREVVQAMAEATNNGAGGCGGGCDCGCGC
jgi:hypothetical protein